MKKSFKKTLLCAALSVIPFTYSYHMYHDLNDQLNKLQKQNEEQEKMIKQLKSDIELTNENIKESEVKLRRRFNEFEKEIKQIKIEYSFIGLVTAYSPYEESTGKSPNDPDFKVTASGAIATQGRTIAMDKSIPFGTLVKIEGFDNIFIVEDRGGKIKGNRVDIYFERVEDAIKFGEQKRKIYIIKLKK